MRQGFDAERPVDVIALSSGGGHWEELCCLARAFEGVNTMMVCAGEHAIGADANVRDANLNTPWQVLLAAIEIWCLVRRHRPTVIITTGAAPGALAILAGRFFKAKTLFIDSIANAEKPSLSARIVRRFATLTLSQWPDVSRKYDMGYAGSVL